MVSHDRTYVKAPSVAGIDGVDVSALRALADVEAVRRARKTFFSCLLGSDRNEVVVTEASVEIEHLSGSVVVVHSDDAAVVEVVEPDRSPHFLAGQAELPMIGVLGGVDEEERPCEALFGHRGHVDRRLVVAGLEPVNFEVIGSHGVLGSCGGVALSLQHIDCTHRGPYVKSHPQKSR